MKPKLTKFKFEPDADVRNLDVKKLIDLTFTFEARHHDKEKRDQYVTMTDAERPKIREVLGDRFYSFSGWCGKYVGEEKTQFKARILDAWLVTSENGGQDNHRAKTYKEFFNEERKKQVMRVQKGGLGMRINTRGDIDRADIRVILSEDMRIDTMTWIEAPGEWYSESFQDYSKFKFSEGFWETAEKAIESFQHRRQEDLFGERYFPVCVFPDEKRDWNEAYRVVGWAKSHSKPILKDGLVIFGTRCKPHEYQDVIDMAYKAGGKVAKFVDWDWD